MKLSEVIDSIHVKSVSGSLDVEVSGIFYDSRQVIEGGVFCALVGGGADGNEYIDAAIENGAVAIISGKPYPGEFKGTWVPVAGPHVWRWGLRLAIWRTTRVGRFPWLV